MTQPPKDDDARAGAAQAALAEGLERAHELVCEARLMLRPQGEPATAGPEPPAEAGPTVTSRPRDDA